MEAALVTQFGIITGLIVNGALYEIRERRKAAASLRRDAENRLNEEKKAALAALVVDETKRAAKSVADDTREVARTAVVIAAKTDEVRQDLALKAAEMKQGSEAVRSTLEAHSGDEIARLDKLKDVTAVIHALVNQRLTDALNANKELLAEVFRLGKALAACQARYARIETSRKVKKVA